MVVPGATVTVGPLVSDAAQATAITSRETTRQDDNQLFHKTLLRQVVSIYYNEL